MIPNVEVCPHFKQQGNCGYQSDLDLDFNAVCLHLMKRSKRFHILWWKIKKSACWECMKCCLVLFALVEICFLSIANMPLGFWDLKMLHTHSSVYLKFPSRFIYSTYVMLSCVPHLSISVFRSASQYNLFFQWKGWKAWFTPKFKFCQHLLSLMLSQICITFWFLYRNAIGDILKNVQASVFCISSLTLKPYKK